MRNYNGVWFLQKGVAKPPRAIAVQYTPTFLLYKLETMQSIATINSILYRLCTQFCHARQIDQNKTKIMLAKRGGNEGSQRNCCGIQGQHYRAVTAIVHLPAYHACAVYLKVVWWGLVCLQNAAHACVQVLRLGRTN